MMAYTRRLRLKGVPFVRRQGYERVGFQSLKYIKGWGNLSFGSVKGPKRANR